MTSTFNDIASKASDGNLEQTSEWRKQNPNHQFRGETFPQSRRGRTNIDGKCMSLCAADEREMDFNDKFRFVSHTAMEPYCRAHIPGTRTTQFMQSHWKQMHF
jgi:hypothetical protein